MCCLKEISLRQDRILAHNKPQVKQVSQCRDWARGIIEFRVQELIQRHYGSSYMVLYTDGTVTIEGKSGWGFVAYRNGRVVIKTSGAFAVITSSSRMETEAVTGQQSECGGVVKDSQRMPRKTGENVLRRERVNLLGQLHAKELTWIFCLGHVSVHGSELAERLAGQAEIQARLRMDKEDISKAVFGHAAS